MCRVCGGRSTTHVEPRLESERERAIERQRARATAIWVSPHFMRCGMFVIFVAVESGGRSRAHRAPVARPQIKQENVVFAPWRAMTTTTPPAPHN